MSTPRKKSWVEIFESDKIGWREDSFREGWENENPIPDYAAYFGGFEEGLGGISHLKGGFEEALGGISGMKGGFSEGYGGKWSLVGGFGA